MNAIARWSWSWYRQVLLRRAPQEDPLSWRALAAALSAYVFVGLWQAAYALDRLTVAAITLTEAAVMGGFTALVLFLAGRSLRLGQTLTALAGTGALLGLVGWLLVSGEGGVQEPSGLLVLGRLAWLAWTVAVQAHIFRHALSTRYGFGLMLAGLHTVLIIVVVETLFPRVIAESGVQ